MPRQSTNISDHYYGQAALLTEVLQVGWDCHRIASVGLLKAHAHRNAYEICYISRGNVDWWVGPEIHRVKRGEIYITRPDERHGGVDSVLHPCELYFVQVVLPKQKPWPGLTKSQTQLLTRSLAAMQYRCFAGSAVVADYFERLMQEHRQPTEHSVVAARAALHALLVTVLRDHDAAAASATARGGDLSAPIARALRWMEAHVGEDYHVRLAARAGGLGVSRFHERFLSELGLTPAEHRARRRVELGKRLLLKSNDSITGVAMRLGFSSSQYFATVFKKYVGMTPGAYRRHVGGSGGTAAGGTAGGGGTGGAKGLQGD